MILKSIEIRDRMTFIPAIAIKMVPKVEAACLLEEREREEAQRYLLRRCGYEFEYPAVILLRMDGDSQAAPADPYHWCDRTFQTVHIYVTENFDALEDGQVVDVEYLLSETQAPKVSERLTNG